MADRPNRPQPFRFWLPFWANPTLPSPRPPIPARRQPLPQIRASTPLPSAQPQSTSQTQPRSPPASATRAARPQPPSPLPSLTRNPSQPGNRKEQQPSSSRLQVQSPTVARRASHPSQPSELDSKEQPAFQNASISASKRASQPQPEAIQESSQLPSQPLPSSSQPKSPIGSISHPNQSNLPPQESQPVVQTKSPTQLQPELRMQTISQTQEMKPIQPAYMPQGNQPTQDLETQPQEPQAEASDEPEKQMAAELVSIASDTKPTRSSLKAGDIIAERRSSKPENPKKQENVAGNESTKNGSSRKGGKIAISTMSCASFADGERAHFEKEIKEGLSRLAQNLSIGNSERIGNGQAVSIITLAGENNGASMVTGSDTDVHRGFKHDTGNVEASSDNVNGRWNPQGNKNSAITASINSNVQSINNSTMHDSSCNVRDPGIHLNLSSKKTETANLRGQTEPLKPKKTAPSITPDQKPSHEPRIRRRCLRALFMESSESDPENPQKPRRHGCRFNCEDKKKGKVDLDGTSTINSNARARQVREGTSKA